LISINGKTVRALDINKGLHKAPQMIVCSCNVFSDGEVRSLVAACPPVAGTAQVFRSLGHQPQCGRCARTIHGIMRESAVRDTRAFRIKQWSDSRR